MIRIRYSADPYGEIELEGSGGELHDLHQGIIGMKQSPLSVPVDTSFDPSPYQCCLHGLYITKTEGLLFIAVEDHKLCISGTPENLTLFAENVPYDVDEHNSPVPYHIHFDRIGREDKMAEDSLELVITLRE